MIKRVIFDIDNTLMPWKAEYYNEIYSAFSELNIKCSEKELLKIKEAFGEYENNYYTFNKKLMIEFINKYTGENYPEEFIKKLINRWSKCAPENLPEATIKTLEYVKNKYEVVTLTDWYKEQQVKRLEKAKILKYFQEVYAAENTKRKPFKEAFMQAIGENKPEECIMIGDNFERDIEGALKAGLQAIYYNPNNINNQNSANNKDKVSYYELKNEDGTKQIKYYTISKLDEIMSIL